MDRLPITLLIITIPNNKLILKLNSHITHSIISLIFITIISKRSIIFPLTFTMSHYTHIRMISNIFWNIYDEKFSSEGIRLKRMWLRMKILVLWWIVYWLGLRKTMDYFWVIWLFRGGFGEFVGGGWGSLVGFWLVSCSDPEIKPLIISMCINIILQKQIKIISITLPKHTIQIPTLETTLKLKPSIHPPCPSIPPCPKALPLKHTNMITLKRINHIRLYSIPYIPYINGHIIFCTQVLIMTIIYTL